MFDDIHDKLKFIAYYIVVISIVIGIIWFLYSLSTYDEYKDYLQKDNFSVQYQLDQNEMITIPYNSVSGFVGSIALIVSGIIVSYLFYGFGEVIYYLKSINSKLEKSTNHEDDDEQCME